MSFRLSADALAASGEAVALASREETTTYFQLADRARAIGEALRAIGARDGTPVGLVSAARGHDEASALVGIAHARAVVLPLDHASPAKRLASILAARGAGVVVHDEAASALASAVTAELTASGSAPLARVVVDAKGNVTSTIGAVAEPSPMPSDVACVLHTSGSTGTPKPVPITWAGLDAFTRFTNDLVALGPGDRVLRVAELLFDLAWFDHVGTLRAGATLVTMSRRELAAGRALVAAFADLRPTVVYGVPSMFMKLVAALPEGAPLSPAPRVVLYAGEVFPPRELAAFAARVPGAPIYDFFGPTETNVCTYHRVRPEDLDGVSETPIGLAAPYAACELLGDDGARIDGPGTGELVVSGPTALGGTFATRDRVERKADGLFYFRGRIDRMVKIRGFRVEPGDVEAALAAHPAVRQAAVVPFDDPKLGKVLRAFCALGERADADERALRMFVAERLPAYMVPDKVALVAELPVTPTGKIDYAALARA